MYSYKKLHGEVNGVIAYTMFALKNYSSVMIKVSPFHFLPGSIARAFKTIERLAKPQYAGSDCVWKYEINLKKPSIVPF